MKPELHVVLGMDPDEYEAALQAGRMTVHWEGLGATKDPRWHSHPLLGVTGHAHKDGRLLHGHLPEIHWGEVVLIEPSHSDATATSTWEATEMAQFDGYPATD